MSKKDGTFVNVLSLTYIVNIPSIYLLPALHDYLYGMAGPLLTNCFVSLCYFVPSLAFAFFYLYGGRSTIRLPWSEHAKNLSLISISMIAIAAILNSEFFLLLVSHPFDPRAIYIVTRTGYGIYSYTSSFASYLALILVLFIPQKTALKSLIFFLALIILYSHGSKGQIIAAIFIPFLYSVYVNQRKITFQKTLPRISFLVTLIVLSFVFTMGTSTSLFRFLSNLSNYSNYSENAVTLIDSTIPLQWGKLTFENNITSIIPRAIYPAKPKDLGSIYLAKKFFPEWYYSNTGAPSFGVGVQFADFGILALPYLIIFSAFHGLLTRVFVNSLRKRRHPSYFIILVFLCGVTLIPTGLGWYFPETILFSILIGILLSFKFA